MRLQSHVILECTAVGDRINYLSVDLVISFNSVAVDHTGLNSKENLTENLIFPKVIWRVRFSKSPIRLMNEYGVLTLTFWTMICFFIFLFKILLWLPTCAKTGNYWVLISLLFFALYILILPLGETSQAPCQYWWIIYLYIHAHVYTFTGQKTEASFDSAHQNGTQGKG